MDPEVTMKECPFCLAKVPKAAQRCQHCTSYLNKAANPKDGASGSPKTSKETLPIWRRPGWITAIAGLVTAIISGISPTTSAINGCYGQILKEKDFEHQRRIATEEQNVRFRKEYLAMALGKNYDLKQRPPVLRFLSRQTSDPELAFWAMAELPKVVDKIESNDQKKISLANRASEAREEVIAATALVTAQQVTANLTRPNTPQKNEAMQKLTSLKNKLIQARFRAEEANRKVPVTNEAICRSSQHCLLHAFCTARNGRCQATSDADCGSSGDCKESGWCFFVDGRCDVKPDSKAADRKVSIQRAQ